MHLAALAERGRVARETERWMKRRPLDAEALEAARARQRALEAARRAADAERAESERYARERVLAARALGANGAPPARP